MDQLADLNAAREHALSWRIVAVRLMQLEASGPLAPDGQPWIRAVEAVSGYSVNHLRRMTRASTLIDGIIRIWPQYAGRLSSLTFTHAEILGRLWETDRLQVETLLKAERWPTYAQLLAVYEQTRSRRVAPKAAGKLAVGRFRSHVRQLLRYEFGSALRDPVPHHPYCKPDFLAMPSFGMAIAWDCVLISEKLDEDAIRRRFVAWSTEATFVAMFWLVVQDDRCQAFMRQCLADLELANVGVAVPDGSHLATLVAPYGPPSPDRRQGAAAFWP